ncbi:Sialic acid permease [Serratia fonticola]|uniref:Sialic acid permease n=1 Tax=Serratia fonticola TaxID=47917 RepID=A0A4U9V0H0_SERFO|nr:Sialic acid permease [Serratia fonticola]
MIKDMPATSLNKNHATPGKAMLASVTGYAMDGFDLLILGFMLPVITTELGLTSSQAGSLVTWTLIGAVIGGVIFGHLSDRFGRIRVLTITILMFSLFTGLCAVAVGYWDLLAYRTLAGIGLGGEFGIGMALIAEAWPQRSANRASAYVGMGWQLGVLAAAFLTPLAAALYRLAWHVPGGPAASAGFLPYSPNHGANLKSLRSKKTSEQQLSFTQRLKAAI